MEWAPQGKGGFTIHRSECSSIEMNEIQKKNSCDTVVWSSGHGGIWSKGRLDHLGDFSSSNDSVIQ